MHRDEKQTFSELQDILLREEREEIARIRSILDKREALSDRIDPIIQSHIDQLKQNFPASYEKVIDKQIEEKINNSKEEILDLLYPVMGSMIRKYINYQFQLLKEKIDLQIREKASKGLLGKIKRFAFGISHSEWVLNRMGKANLEAVYIIEQHSGLILGSTSIKDTIDLDLMAGMLTAIKSFAEDAFAKNEQIETIQYDYLNIFIVGFPKFYIAVTLDGAINAIEKEKLRNDLIDFAKREIDSSTFHTKEFNLTIRKKLDKFFLLPQRKVHPQIKDDGRNKD